MRIAYLQLGSPRHGLHRYGRLLGEALQKQGVEISWVDAQLGQGAAADRAAVSQACEGLRGADACHAQFNFDVWGRRPQTVEANFGRFLDEAPCPVAVTIHDSMYLPGFRRRLRRGAEPGGPHADEPPLDPGAPQAGPGASLARRAWSLLKNRPNQRAALRVLRALRTRPAVRFVFNQFEADYLAGGAGAGAIEVAPHFVENRRAERDASVEQEYDLPPGGRVLTVLGFIHSRKGNDIVIESLPLTPRGTVAVFAGGAPSDDPAYPNYLRRRAAELGVADRVRTTGFLDEPRLNAVIARTDIAVCPFRSVSASGSLSTWLSAGKPIVASRLPQLESYGRLAPDAIRLFRRGDHRELADRVASFDAQSMRAAHADATSAAEKLSVSRLAADHLAVFERCSRIGAG